ncbi:uncharacterized protein LOC129282437 isoform X1 [Lytechinus pictus]|uniref:uncharacterized protein LOC129282437 isoform X1 n=2 Tax=Lytechinus pictus TaxID=7653 RepID=UPI00240D2468|nr:uncharacterized protein LOC129282437 isoform X1 [Lytechinus pictus]
MPTRKLRVREMPQNADMTACYLLTNPRDASINVSGHPVTGTNNNMPNRTNMRNVSSAVHGHHTNPPNELERYVPVLTVKRPVTTVSAPALPMDYGSGQGEVRAPQSAKSHAFGRPVPPVDCFQSRTPIAQRVRNCSRSLAVGTTQRPITDLRTGFMRTMSKPTPGELDLKLHQEKQAIDKIKADLRREQASFDDPDRLDMKDILKFMNEHPVASSTRRPRPRAAKRRVPHATLVSSEGIESRTLRGEELTEKEAKAQKAISEYKHRLNALSSQMRSTKERSQSAVSRYSHNSGQHDFDRQSLRLAPNNNDQHVSIQLLNLPDYGGRSSPQCSVDSISSRSVPLQTRLSPRSSAISSPRTASSSPGRRTRQPQYPEPIYIPSGGEDFNGTNGEDQRQFVKLSMRRSTNVTRETSLMTDMDPNNPPILTVQVSFPRPTAPPSNTPISASDEEGDNDLDGSIFGDDDSLETNWSSRSCSQLSSVSSSRMTCRSCTPSATSNREKNKTNATATVPSVSL